MIETQQQKILNDPYLLDNYTTNSKNPSRPHNQLLN